ncbi:amylo-alpha-1,6-glucosidase [Agromyces mediolanus]|uniref:amylo-alpha-1,6-glucosidase n=1 Tax=Agromyces mediolanus TaxID=41986 RepID=UPI00203BD0D1|nr:glycogen debranching N-terminal domain-containing protein [Agromyces mediolanus]MCM3658367.1 amylo-alpha-1,6-glucosidase [Agromyces mediolanus]
MDTQRQPFLHREIALYSGPTQAWSPADGQIEDRRGLGGFYHSDVRIVSVARLTLNGEELELIGSGSTDAGHASFLYAARVIDRESADPLVAVRRDREVHHGRIRERIEFTGETTSTVEGTLRLEIASDLAGMDAVKNGRTVPSKTPAVSDGRSIVWRDSSIVASLILDDRCEIAVEGDLVVLSWAVSLGPGERAVHEWGVEAEDTIAVLGPPPTATPEWPAPALSHSDPRLARFVDTSLSDLAALRSVVSTAPDDVVLAGGIPWFQTLYGRDSIWAAEMLLPLTWKVAASTLRALASLQGTRVDAETAEQPGKILHEIRRSPGGDEQRPGLPPIYYGTVDATVLWIGLLHDAWRGGMPDAEVEALLPNLERAISWIFEYGDADGDGLIEYLDESGTGLANQGWKDSGDSVQFQDGTLARGSVALVEVQAYAYRALRVAAEVLEAFGRPGAAECRAAADRLHATFHEQYWVSDEHGPYLAMALDGDKQPVDALASNMGHVIGSGILDDAQIALVAERLMGDDLFSGFGIRTLSTSAGRYWPLRYHGGSVWPHDSALIAKNLANAGHTDAARRIANGLLDAAEDFDYRLPELFAGYAQGTVPHAMPYPAACPVICWSAACAVTVASLLGGLQ